jgi:hypothetical protein
VYAGEAPDGEGEVAIGAGEILGPEGIPFVPVPVAAGIAIEGSWGEHEAGEGPLGLLLIIGRERDFTDTVLGAGELAEGMLGEQYAEQREAA